MAQNRNDPKILLREGALRLGLHLDDQQVAKFLVYLEQLKRWSRRINLTSITGDRAIIERHFLDSLVGSAGFKPHEGLRLLDIGTGAGFPGLPLKLYHPEIHLTLVEAVHKKAAFLHQLCGILKLHEVFVLTERIEALYPQREHQGAYEVIVARAFAKPKLTWEVASPFLKPGGRILIYLTPSAARDLNPVPGWQFQSLDYELPFSEAKRSLLMIDSIG